MGGDSEDKIIRHRPVSTSRILSPSLCVFPRSYLGLSVALIRMQIIVLFFLSPQVWLVYVRDISVNSEMQFR